MSNQVIGFIDVSAANGISNFNISQGAVRFYNHSIFGIQVTLADGGQYYIPPQERRVINVDQGSGRFTWEQVLALNVGGATPVSSLMVVETVDPSDVLIESDLAALGGTGNVGNNVPNNVLQNDGSISGSTFIEATPQGGGQTWLGKNDGTLVISGLSGGILVPLLVITPGGAGNALLFFANNKIEINDDGNGRLLLSSSEVKLTMSLSGANRRYLHIEPPDGKDWGLLELTADHSLAFFSNTDTYTALQLNASGQKLDNGAITTDGAGALRVGSLFTTGTLEVDGSTSLDNGAITTDGAGNITAVQAITATGTITGILAFLSGQIELTKSLGGSNQSYVQIAPSDGLTWGIDELSTEELAFVQTAIKLTMNTTKGTKFMNTGHYLGGVSAFSGTGSGTVNHGLGTTPTGVLPMQNSVGSQTMGYDTLGSSTVHITAGAGNAWEALAWKSTS